MFISVTVRAVGNMTFVSRFNFFTVPTGWKFDVDFKFWNRILSMTEKTQQNKQ